jgi:hypothetical protein
MVQLSRDPGIDFAVLRDNFAAFLVDARNPSGLVPGGMLQETLSEIGIPSEFF